MTDLREQVAAIVDQGLTPLCNCDLCEKVLSKADAIIALVQADAFERAAEVVDRWAEHTFPAPEEEAVAIAAAIRALATSKEAQP